MKFPVPDALDRIPAGRRSLILYVVTRGQLGGGSTG